jgi:hypothetical protein
MESEYKLGFSEKKVNPFDGLLERLSKGIIGFLLFLCMIKYLFFS